MIRFAVCLVWVWALAMLPMYAKAQCTVSNGPNTTNVSLPGSITVDPSEPVGTILARSTPSTESSGTAIIQCSHGSRPALSYHNAADGSITNASTTSSEGVVPTKIPGVGYRIRFTGGTDVPTVPLIELVKTGPVANGASLNPGSLGYTALNTSSGPEIFQNIALTGAATFLAPSCTVNTRDITVVLPTVSNQAFRGVGSVAGATPFAIALRCATGSNLSITLDTSNRFKDGATGVIAPTIGHGRANNIGVQIVDLNGIPTTFGRATVVGDTPDGILNIPFYARYYQTADQVSAGIVKATATFTLSYK